MLKNYGAILRERLAQPGILIAPGAYDGLSAKLIEQAGFEAAYMSGAGVSASILGQPDIGLITETEMADAAKHIASAVDIPVIADADTGYGNPMNVIRTIHDYEMAGVAAVQLEDQISPKRCGHLSGKELMGAADFAAKLRAAANEKKDDHLVIIARTDARAVEGFESAIDRCKRYIDAGADVIFFEAPQSISEVEEVGKILGPFVPLLSNQVPGGKTPTIPSRELEQMGYKLVIYPTVCTTPAMLRMQSALEQLKESGNFTIEQQGGSAMDMFTNLGIGEWLEKGNRYAPTT